MINIKNIAKEVFEIESKEISNLSNLLTEDFERSVNAVVNCKGKLIISGMGKSGIIGKIIAATSASTSGGDRKYAPYMAKLANAVGVDGFFFEVHNNPEEALSDGPNIVYLKDFRDILKSIK